MSAGPAKSVAQLLRDSPEAATWMARWEASRRAAACIAPVCASLTAGFDPVAAGGCELRDTTLRLTVRSAAQASKLRQAAPRLLSVLGAAGFAVYEIRLSIQPVVSTYPGHGSEHSSAAAEALPPVPTAAVDQLSELALTVGESPLKAAVERLAATLTRHRKRQA